MGEEAAEDGRALAFSQTADEHGDKAETLDQHVDQVAQDAASPPRRASMRFR